MMKNDAPSFKVLVLAPFDGDPSRGWDRPPMTVDSMSLDEVMAAMKIRLWLPLEKGCCPAGGLEFHFESLKDLHPDGLIKTQPYLIQADHAGRFLAQSQARGLPAARIREGLKQWPDLPSVDIKDPIDRGKTATSQPISDTIDNLLNMVAVPDPKAAGPGRDPFAAGQIDALIRQIMRELFGQAFFRQMEAAWRGLRLLLQQGAVGDNVKVALAAVHPKTLQTVLDGLTPHLIEDPPGLILLDMSFDNSPLSIALLSRAAQWAATLMVPLASWVSPTFFQISRWQDLPSLPFLPHHLEDAAYTKFRNLVKSPDGHWVVLTCNRFLSRYPYGPDNRCRHVDFNEPDPLWIPPVWALGTLVAQAMSRTGRPARFTDRSRFRVQDLALNTAEGVHPVPVEHLLEDDRRDQMIRAGITPLTAERGSDKVFFTRAVCLSGSPMAFQLLFTQVIHFVLWCKDNLPAETDPAVLETQLRLAFQVFSEQSSPHGLASCTIAAGTPMTNGKIPLRIVALPAPEFLPGRQTIEINLDW